MTERAIDRNRPSACRLAAAIRKAVGLSVAMALAAAPMAQVPSGQVLRLCEATTTSSLKIVDPSVTGSIVDITGLAEPPNSQVPAGMIHPVTGDLYLMFSDFSSYGSPPNGTVYRATFGVGPVITQGSYVANLGPGTRTGFPTDIEIGPSGRMYCLNDFALYELDTTTLHVIDYDVEGMYPLSGTLFSGAAIDWGRNKLWVSVESSSIFIPSGGPVIEYDLSGPITRGSGTIVLDLNAAGVGDEVYDVVYGDDALWFAVENATSSVWKWDLVSSALAAVPGAQGLDVRALDHDRTTGLLHLMEFSAGFPVVPDVQHALDPTTGALTTFSFPGSGTSQDSAVLINDFLDTTTVLPQLADASIQNDFGFAAHGLGGDPAGIGITHFNGTPVGLLLVGIGVCDLGGFYTVPSVSVPAGTFSQGDTVTVASARWDVASGRLVSAPPTTVSFR